LTSLSKKVLVSETASGGGFVLAGSTAGPLAWDHHALEEELSAPHSPGLTSFECTVEAQGPDRAPLAQSLGVLHVAGRLGEPQFGVVDPTGQQLVIDLDSLVMELTQADIG